jgi:type I restriction enzyme S subunit
LAQSKLWPAGTLCITIAANIADTAILAIPGCFPDSVIGFLPDPDKSDVRFVKYLLDTKKASFQAASRGTTQDNLSLEKLLTFELGVPSLSLQRRIADILSAYDDLIEICERRIRVLDGMARALFHEWFVLFRYPGAPHLHIASPIGGIPAGWHVASLGDHIRLETGKRPPGGAVGAVNGVPSVGAENVNKLGRHDYSAEKYVPREYFAAMTSGVVRDRDVALYKDGAHIGRSTYFRDGFPHAEFAVNEHVFLLRTTSDQLCTNHLYLWLQDPQTVQTIRSRNANAAQPGVNRGAIESLLLALPPRSIGHRFDRLVEPVLAAVVAFARQADVLRRTRNLLRPRLLSGKIPLETADPGNADLAATV